MKCLELYICSLSLQTKTLLQTIKKVNIRKLKAKDSSFIQILDAFLPEDYSEAVQEFCC